MEVNRSGSESSILKLAAERLRDRKPPSSKYDYIKIKVWLGEGLDHYFILSRFLIARVLTVTKVPQDKVSFFPFFLHQVTPTRSLRHCIQYPQHRLESLSITGCENCFRGQEMARRQRQT